MLHLSTSGAWRAAVGVGGLATCDDANLCLILIVVHFGYQLGHFTFRILELLAQLFDLHQLLALLVAQLRSLQLRLCLGDVALLLLLLLRF